MTIFEQNARLLELSLTHEQLRNAVQLYMWSFCDCARYILSGAYDVNEKIRRLDAARRRLNEELKRAFTFTGVACPAELLADHTEK